MTDRRGTTKLDRSDIICGYPAKKIRDFLGYARDGAFSDGDLLERDVFLEIATDYFGDGAENVVAELFKRGWLLEDKAEKDDFEYAEEGASVIRLTQLGKQSRIISLKKRFSRIEGEAIVADLVGRAKMIDARNDLPYGISELRLYGSMLDPQCEEVGDVDVAFELYRRKLPAGMSLTDWNFARAAASGRDLSFRQRLGFGSREVNLLLQGGGQRLSLQRMSDFCLMEPIPKFRVIFQTNRMLSPRKGIFERNEV
jgi:hypothetical protein